ncbi:MAG TPA: alanine racemase, partial [Micavibrio sp.]|nr:alanine racemase [Micavibrio sp.]
GIAKHFPDTPKSLCNSAGVFCDSSYYMDNIRPGMALYGLNPTPHTDNPMQNVVGLKARILQVRQALKDETVGYGATYRFDKNSTTATVGLGYADGFLRSLTNKGQMFYKGEACPIVGRVSMDAVTVDITHLENKPKQGDALDVICDQQTADDLARDASTIGYEILTSLGSRYSREYV